MVRAIPCAILDRCGLCTRMRGDDAVQDHAKVSDIAKALRRGVDGFVASPRRVGYRARITVRPHPSGGWGYRSPGSHEGILVRSCAIARPEIDRVLAVLPDARVEQVELRTNGTAVVVVVHGKRPPPGHWVEATGALPGVTGIAHGERTLWGDTELWFPVGDGVSTREGMERPLSATTFFQVNLELNALLVAAVVERVVAASPHGVLDLFSGAGNFGLPLLARGIPVVAVESDAHAIRDLERAIEVHSLRGATIRRADANRLQAGETFFDVAILDPPRAGAPGLLERLALTRPRAIVYVSCNARTLGRDLEPVDKLGYDVGEITVFDMFPQTEHAEVLAVLVRR